MVPSRLFRLVCCLGLLSFGTLPAAAQHRSAGRAPAMPRATRVTSTISAPTVTSAPRAQVIRIRRQASGTTNDPSFIPVDSGSGIPLGTSFGFLPSFGFSFPSPGFSFEHQAALDRNLAVKALIDPVTQARLALELQIRRSTPVVPFFPFASAAPVIIMQSPTPVVVIEEGEAQGERGPTLVAGPARTRGAYEPQPTEIPHEVARETPPAPPLPDLNEIVLVRRDGKLVPVIAYSTQGDRLVYVTPEGMRRSMLVSELDAEATRAFNEERGASVRIGRTS